MILRPLHEWDEAYLDEVNQSDEKATLERKQVGPDGIEKDKDRIAKQVCAFANAGGGFVVFGLKDAKAGGGFDAGVPEKVGHTPVKAWIEQTIPTMHQPPITGCEAKWLHCAHHQSDLGVLVISIPSSDRRPHWLKGNEEEAYLRVGEHSDRMRRQTFLDIANRAIVSQGEVVALNPRKDGGGRSYNMITANLNPIVRIVAGPVCELWAVELTLPPGAGRFPETWEEVGQAWDDGTRMFVRCKQPLFPLRPTPILRNYGSVDFDRTRADETLEVVFYPGSGRPERRLFPLRELVAHAPSLITA